MFGLKLRHLKSDDKPMAIANGRKKHAPVSHSDRFLLRANRNDTVGAKRRIRQIVDDNRLL